jgi:hypothetical protein
VLPGGAIRRDDAPDGGREGPARAGLWFLDRVPPTELLEAMRDFPLPEVEAV